MENTRKILITGGAGNIGGSLAKKLVADKNNFVVIADNLFTGSIEKLPASSFNFRFIKADVNHYNEISSIMLAHSFDYVFHYAAVVGVKRTLNNPLLVLKDIEGVRNILDLSKNTGVKRVFYSSSSEVYGEPVSIPQYEDITPLNSRLPYAIVKNVGEAFCKSYSQEYGLDYTVFRFFNTYGPGQSEDFVLPRFLKAALQNKDIHIYGNGKQTRTFCYVDDNIETTTAILYNDTAKNEILNIGSDEEISVRELAQKIVQISNSSSKIIYLAPLEEGDMKRRLPDISKMKSFLPRKLIPLDVGIIKLMEIYKRSDI